MRASLLLLALSLAACDASTETRPAAAVYVGSRGGTVTRIDASGRTEALGAFDGEIASLVERGRRLYVLTSTVADSGRVVEIDLDTGARIRETRVLAPRRMAITEGTGYVTSSLTLSLTPVRLATGRADMTVQFGARPDGIAAVDGRLYMAVWNGGLGSDVLLASPLTRTLTETVAVGCDGPRDVLADNEGEVWVFCTGRPATTEAPATNGAVVVLGGSVVVARFDLEAPLGTISGHDAAFSASTDEALVAVGARLVRFDTAANARLGDVEIPGAAEARISTVAIDAATGQIYLGRLAETDPFGAPGTVSVHDASGAQTARFAAGVVPVSVVFERR